LSRSANESRSVATGRDRRGEQSVKPQRKLASITELRKHIGAVNRDDPQNERLTGVF
jgi:hypothetical protein